MKPEAQKLLYDMLDACREITNFAAGKSFDDYERSSVLRSAVERQCEILGEAATRLRDADPETFESIPEAYSIIGLRNRLIHGYDTVDDAIIWNIVEEKVATLAEQIDEFLS